MACMRLGSKSEAFHREGQTWLCNTGLPSDVTIQVGDMSFQLHKFPLLSKSGLLEKLVEEFSSQEEAPACVLNLHEVPGGAKAFELIAKFCYGVKIEINASNIVSLRCAAEYLQMSEDFGEGNLISQTEAFLNEVLSSWGDSLKALETIEEELVQPHAEELHVVSRCIDSLAMKASSDPTLFGWPLSERNEVKSPKGTVMWNGISSETRPQHVGDDWWFEDVSVLSLPMFKRVVVAIEARGVKPETISSSLLYYARKYLPLMNSQSSLTDVSYINPTATISEADQRTLLEEIVGLLPNKKGVTSSKCLLRLLRIAMILHANPSCRENLEKRVGNQLEQALLVDLLIPNMGYSVETLYDIDCIQRILDHFMLVHHPAVEPSSSPCIVEEGQLMATSDSLTPMTMVANLVDGYLAEVAVDVNLKLPKFQALAAVMPDYARPLDDGIYNAIDVYLKAHPWLTDSEKEQLCRLMNCQKLSLEASTHAAQNERLPLRVIVQVLFFEQLRLRTSISGWFFVSDNLDTSQNIPTTGNLGLPRTDGGNSRQMEAAAGQDQHELSNDHDMRLRVMEIEKECSKMRKELQKLVNNKKTWSLLPRRFGFRKKSQSCSQKESKNYNRTVGLQESSLNEKPIHDNGQVAH